DGAGFRHACRGRTAQRRRIVRSPGRRSGESDQLRGRRPAAGLPAATADGARRGHLQDREARPGHVVTASSLLLDTVHEPDTDAAPGSPLATWPARAGAFAIDVLLGIAVIATMAVSAWSAPWRGWLWW